MKFFSKIITSRKNTQNHQKNAPTRNREAFQCLISLHFPIELVRKSLVDLNGITVAKLANGVAVPTLYGAIRGENENEKARAIVAQALGLAPDELFPDQDGIDSQ